MQPLEHPLVLVQFKALGDFVVAAECIRRRRTNSTFEVLAGEHLAAIAEVLDIDFAIRFFDHDEHGIPALIALKSQGMVRGMKSAISLKKALHRASIPRDALIVFDKLDKRERFLAAGLRSVALPKADNVYLSYDAFFDQLCFETVSSNNAGADDGPIRIYPGSRLPERHVPITIVSELLAMAPDLGRSAELMLLEGERPDLEISGLPFTRVPRTFAALLESIRGAGKIISADSMPAHLSEYVGKPVFVYSPTPNRYWLPRSSFRGDWDALFEAGGAADRIRAFMQA